MQGAAIFAAIEGYSFVPNLGDREIIATLAWCLSVP